ncbi:hypothetical protein J6590_034835 [Homalodisca vitripennis]|nr:hypothetical protein J6590_034835 [Homalodisca vitripennis]
MEVVRFGSGWSFCLRKRPHIKPQNLPPVKYPATPSSAPPVINKPGTDGFRSLLSRSHSPFLSRSRSLSHFVAKTHLVLLLCGDYSAVVLTLLGPPTHWQDANSSLLF